MKKNLIVSFLLLTIISTSVFAQVNSPSKEVAPLLEVPTTFPNIDRTLYDEDGISLIQPNFPKDFPLPDKTSTSSFEMDNIANDLPSLALDPKDVKQGELAACFDYYNFGSVNISLATDRTTYESGGLPAIITGEVKNNNKYPLVGLDIKARLVKNIPSPDYIRAEIMTLDEFDIAKNITIKANGIYTIPSYGLNLPLNTPAGDYQILFYAVEQNRFNMSGLSFTNDIIASKVDFTITGKNPEHIYLDQTKITVGGKPHNIMAFVTQHIPDIEIPVIIPLKNPSNIDKKMTVTYDLYSWDALQQENKISTKSETIMVPAKSSKNLKYILDKGVLPVYYLTITAQPESQIKDKSVFKEKTMSNIRFVIIDSSKPRINFTGINSFPLKKGSEATLFTCFHNTNNGIDLNNVKIETVLYDQDNKEISRLEYNGKTTSEISGLIKKFTTKKDIFNFTIITKMFNSKGEQLDSIEKKYSCNDIDPSTCPKKLDLILISSIAGIAVILILLIVFIYKKIRNNILKNK